MADVGESEEVRQAKMYRRNTKRLRRNLLERFLMAMKEDLAEWLSSFMNDDLNAINFIDKLDNGVLLCEHANIVQKHAEVYVATHDADRKMRIPSKSAYFRQKGAFKGSFIARDNVANFISWCRELGIPDVVLFETEDLVLRKNEKTVVLTLLELARKAAKFGVKPPQIVELEEEIDREIEADKLNESLHRKKSRAEKNLELEKENDLDQLVQDVVNTCSCPSAFPVKKIGDGKYKFGNSKQLIFVRVMRNHVMVRVGGGWDTLEHYIEKHDPCRLHVGGHVNRKGHAEKTVDQRLSTIMDFNSDGASVCSSESFGSGDGCPLSSISPDSEDGHSSTSFGTFASRRSSMLLESDDELHLVPASKSEPAFTGRLKNGDAEEEIRQSKSETFTKFGSRKLSLLSDNLKETDVYQTRNPGDGWLRKHLNDRKQPAQGQAGDEEENKEEQSVDGKENITEESMKEKMTVESIKKKYGRPVKSRGLSKRGDDSTPKIHRRTLTNPDPKKQPADRGKAPTMEPKNNPQYRSWDQSVSTPKRRKDGMMGTRELSDLTSKRKLERKDSASGIPRPSVSPQRRPSFHKAHTLDVSTLKTNGVRRRGGEPPSQPQSMRRETSADCIVRSSSSRLPLPTFGKTGRLIKNSTAANKKKDENPTPARTRNPMSRTGFKVPSATPRKGNT